MKIFLIIIVLLFSNRTDTPLLLVDIELKKPLKQITAFGAEEYMQRGFPVYAGDIDAIIDATDKVVRLLETEPECMRTDTVAAANSIFYLTRDCEGGSNVSVSLITTIKESRTSFCFALVKRENEKRKAQQRLLDFATYLAR